MLGNMEDESSKTVRDSAINEAPGRLQVCSALPNWAGRGSVVIITIKLKAEARLKKNKN